MGQLEERIIVRLLTPHAVCGVVLQVAEILRDVMHSDLDSGVIQGHARGFYQVRPLTHPHIEIHTQTKTALRVRLMVYGCVQSLHSVLESTWQGEVQRGLKRAADVVAKAGRSSALATLTLTERIQARHRHIEMKRSC
jgi:hypothetical protein